MNRPKPRSWLCWLAVAALCTTALPAWAAGEAIEYVRTGDERISLTVRDASLAEVFEMLSRKERLNILLGSGVEGRVSVNLFDVSLGEAIRGIADAAGYVAERRGKSFVIIQRDDAGKDAAGNTTIRAFDIEYSEPSVIEALVRKHLSRYGEVSILKNRRILVVEDLPEFVYRIGRLLEEVDREPRQILLEAKILEISLDDSMVLGVDWSHTFPAEDGSATVGVRDLASTVAPGLFFDLMTSKFEVALNALTDKGQVRTLSTPTLLALEHEEAEVVIGDRLGFRVTTTINQVTTESVEFLESGIILRFSASVDRNGHIVLSVHPEVSSGVITDGIPSLTTTEVTTTLVVEDGQKIFIAGLIKDRSTDSRTGVPFVSDIPLLGRLFSRTERIDLNTETVVVLSARVVDRAARVMPAEKLEELPPAELDLEERRERMQRNFEEDELSRLESLFRSLPASPDGEPGAQAPRPAPEAATGGPALP